MADTMEEASVVGRLLTSSQWDQIYSVLKEGYKVNLPVYKSCVFKKYKVELIDGVERIVRKSDGKAVASNAEAPDIIRAMHEKLEHADDKKTWHKLRESFGNISRLVVHECINKCQKCMADKHLIYQTLFKTAKPDLENRGHIDVIEMPSDGIYRFILHCTLVKTGFCILRPIRSKSNDEIAFALYCIFVDFGYPDVLQSHSRKFTSDVIRLVNKLSPQTLIISGKYKEEHKKFSLSIKDQLVKWMAFNLTTKWTRGLPQVQWKVNNTVKQSTSSISAPFQDLFSRRPNLEISTFKDLQNLPSGVLYEEEIKPFLELCVPDKHGVGTFNSPVCGKVEGARNRFTTTVQNGMLEFRKRKNSSEDDDTTKKLQIIASYSLATREQIMHYKTRSVSITPSVNKNTTCMSDSHMTVKTVGTPVTDILPPKEAFAIQGQADRISTIRIKTETVDEQRSSRTEKAVAVQGQSDRISTVHLKTEPVDEQSSSHTEKNVFFNQASLQGRIEPTAIYLLPLQIKEEIIVPDA